MGGKGVAIDWYCISQLYIVFLTVVVRNTTVDNGRIDDGWGELTLIGTVFLNFISELYFSTIFCISQLYFVFHSTMYDVRCAMCDVRCAMCNVRNKTVDNGRIEDGGGELTLIGTKQTSRPSAAHQPSPAQLTIYAHSIDSYILGGWVWGGPG